MAGRKANGSSVKAIGKAKPRATKKAPANDVAPAAEIAEAAAPAAAPAPTDASVPGVKIFQIFYDALQRELVDPAFIPLDNRGKPTEYLEFDLFNRLFLSKHVKDTALWGALSWRFTEKTGLSGMDLLGLIEANPGYDIYFCNPYPKLEALFHNLWVQGETAHPDFLRLSRAFLEAAGLPGEEVDLIWPSGVYSAANYFVGSPRFWETYLRFVGAAIRNAEKNLPPKIKQQLHSTEADDRGLHAGSSYMPFIVERLFPLFMRTAGKDLKRFKLPLALPEEDMDVHLRMLRQMKDVGHNTRSPWMVACWANYRSLYFTQLHGAPWTQKYLRLITPGEIKFG